MITMNGCCGWSDQFDENGVVDESGVFSNEWQERRLWARGLRF